MLRSRVTSLLGSDIVLVGLLAIVSRAVALGTHAYIARVIGPQGYGLYALGLTAYSYAAIALGPGLVSWGAREVARDHARAGGLLGTINGTQLVLAAAGYVVAYAVAGLLLGGEALLVVRLSLLMLFPTAIAGDWILQGMQRAPLASLLGMFGGLVAAALVLVTVHGPLDTARVPLIMTAGALTTSLLSYPLLRSRFGVTPWLPARHEVIRNLGSAIPLGASSVLVVILHYTNNVFVFAAGGGEELAVFFAAYRIFELLSTIPALVNVVIVPRLSRLVSQDSAQAHALALRYARGLVLAGALLAVGVWVEAEPLVRLLYGTGYERAIRLMPFMAVAIFFNFAVYGYTNCLVAFKRDRVVLYAVSASAVVSVSGGALLVPWFGIAGAGAVVAGIDLAALLVTLPFYRREVGSLAVRSWVLASLGAVVAIFVAWFARSAGLNAVLIGVAASAAYLLIVGREIATLLRGDVRR